MNNSQEYFQYRCPDKEDLILIGKTKDQIGKTKDQIVKTLEYYRYERKKDVCIPSQGMILPSTSHQISLALPIFNPDHSLIAKVSDTVTFKINANAFDLAQSFMKHYEDNKRGELYKFKKRLTEPFTYFLPESLMKSLRNYEWSVQDMLNIQNWEANRERGMAKAGVVKVLSGKPQNPQLQ